MKYDPVKLEILKNSFIGITEEMGIALKKSSYSPNIKTREDHTCSVFNNKMEMVAQTAHQIGHLGAFPNILKQTMKEHRIDLVGGGGLDDAQRVHPCRSFSAPWGGTAKHVAPSASITAHTWICWYLASRSSSVPSKLGSGTMQSAGQTN